MTLKKTYEIDGNSSATLEQCYDVVSRRLIPDVEWGRNLDAFYDILRGGCGTPERGFVIRWLSSRKPQERLGYRETMRQIEHRLERCHPVKCPKSATNSLLPKPAGGQLCMIGSLRSSRYTVRAEMNRKMASNFARMNGITTQCNGALPVAFLSWTVAGQGPVI